MRMMFVTLKEKRAILNSFNDVVEVKDDNNIFSYYLTGENTHKLIAKGFNEGGDGYIYCKNYNDYNKNKNGWIDVKDFTANEIRELLGNTISSNLH